MQELPGPPPLAPVLLALGLALLEPRAQRAPLVLVLAPLVLAPP